jgi:exodeoxyribonuclease-1
VIDPDAVMITGLSPLELSESGLSEWEFAQQIHQHMSESGTCTVGYNTIRFDDECTRYLFYRNLLDPYAREWKNGNSRWDLLDVVRMMKALRGEGIEWPLHEDGSPSFKLEHLTAANGLSHEQAHDAVSDVLATIALAKLIKEKQPKLFEYAYSLRSKHEVRKHLDLIHHQPHLHFSGKIPAKEHCLGIEIPLMLHPDRNNEAIVIDIRENPSWVLEHDATTLRNWLYSKTEDLPEHAQRPPFKTIHLNRSPMIAPYKMLDDETAEKLTIDKALIEQHRQIVSDRPEIARLALDIFTENQPNLHHDDPEHALYGGFIDDHDRGLLNQMVKDKIPKHHWLDEAHALHDDRLPPLLTSILGRHFPEALNETQLEQWKASRRVALRSSNAGQALTIEEAKQKITALVNEHPESEPLADTLAYTEALEQRWFVTEVSDSAVNIDRNSSGSIQSEPSDSDKNINDQLDLF